MKIIKKSFNFSIKKSENYNSVSIGQGIEVEYETDDTDAVNMFESFKSDLKAQVHKQIDEEIKKLAAKQRGDLLG